MDLISEFPLAKVIYSAVLIGLIGVALKELSSIWFDSRIYVGNFSYFAEGVSKTEQSAAFPAHILGQHQLLRSALVQENQKRQRDRKISVPAGAEVYRGLPSSLPEITRWQSVLSDVELKIQGFDVGKFLTIARSWIVPPEEVNGFVENSKGLVRATVNWPRSSARYDRSSNSPFETGQLSNDASVALAIAASIVWIQAAQQDPAFARVPRDVFVVWALAWWECRYLQGRQVLGQTAADDVERWTNARRLIDVVADRAESYPEIWRMRAEIIDATPSGRPSPSDTLIAEEDRKRYAAAVGQAPVILALKLVTLTENLKTALENVEKAVARNVLQPGLQVWVRRAGQKGPDRDLALTATAVVVEPDGQPKLLLPDFALIDDSETVETEYRLRPDGEVIARAQRQNLMYASDGYRQRGRGVLLANLDSNASWSNALPNSPIGSVTTVAPLPELGAELRVVTIRGEKRAKFSTLEDNLFAVVDGHVTSPGDAGAPVFDSAGKLVAMGHSADERASRFLALDWVFRQGLKLAQ